MFSFKEMSFQNKVLCCLGAGAVPVLLVVVYFFIRFSFLTGVDKEVEILQERQNNIAQKEAFNNFVLKKYKNADPFYLKNTLEAFVLLEKENELISKYAKESQENLTSGVKKSLAFFESGKNKMKFSSGEVQTVGSVQEKTEELIHPVEVNMDDVRKILSFVEGREISGISPPENIPQLIFLDFVLQRQPSSFSSEIFFLDMKLLSRISVED